MALTPVEDNELEQYGVGPASKGKKWYIKDTDGGRELVLFDEKSYQAVYRKPLAGVSEDMPSAATPPEVERLGGKPPNNGPPRTHVSTEDPYETAVSATRIPNDLAIRGMGPVGKVDTRTQPAVGGAPLVASTDKALGGTTAQKAPGWRQEGAYGTTVSAKPIPNDLQVRQSKPIGSVDTAMQPAVPPTRMQNATEGAALAPKTAAALSKAPERSVEKPSGETYSSWETEEVDLGEPKKLVIPKKLADSPIAKRMIEATQSSTGPIQPPSGSVIVTPEALEDAGTGKGDVFSVVIDPNVNEAWVATADGREVTRYKVGTGDITGSRYGKKYFSPVGSWQVMNEVPYSQGEGSYGPLWMGLSNPDTGKGIGYGLHGPHERTAKQLGGGFVNRGYVSHGCLRFSEEDILDLGRYLDVGARVQILPYQEQ